MSPEEFGKLRASVGCPICEGSGVIAQYATPEPIFCVCTAAKPDFPWVSLNALNRQYFKPKPRVRWADPVFPWMQWDVTYPGKKSVFFERHAAAITFALYVARNPNVMESV